MKLVITENTLIYILGKRINNSYKEFRIVNTNFNNLSEFIQE